MKKKLFMLLLVMLMASGCTKKNTETFQIIEGSNVLTKIENKETFILLIGNEDCYSCDMLKEDIEEEAEKNGLVIYEVNSAKVETKVLDQISIAIGTYDTWPTLFYVVDGEIPLNNKYEYTLDPEGVENMAEKYESDQIIVDTVITKKELLAAFAALGIKKGMIVYVQSNLERYAYVNGGNETVIAALQEAVGYEGTIVMPAFSEYMVDPACRKDVRIERDLYEDVRDTQLPFHKKRTKSYHALANQLMCVEGVYRSNHPTHSCVSWGKYAKLFCDRHPLHFSLGKDSFLDKLSEMNGFVLLLGVPYKECDIFKYAASLCENQVIQIVTSPIEKKSGLTFMPMLEMEYSSKGVHQVRVMMEEKKIVSECYIDRSHTRFFKAKEAVMLAKAQFSSRK